MPEFLINLHEVPGVPVGRIFVPCSFTKKPNFLRWYKSVHIYRVIPYETGLLVLFIAPVSEYLRFAHSYPHHRHAAYTLYLLRQASTFFKGLKPPHLPDSEYLD
ncbi:hypothetical protein Cylst_1959 [Cylindrospermum stagnale PCC 7417]|uniref:Uncharacterized protein n=1 Tax=Cylindrospermum stagnale PCC 7417 TaxID=56107 RepID=K9WUZ6_9NOST|nr:hypothetical protein [Cylindrospermum stagnale]AFZ24205.1 hypothetical protein Cylst_1959 [Cylindrospermum stagnale PCC 7417]